MPDRINLPYADIPTALTTNFTVVAGYAGELKRAAMEVLAEETILITVEQIHHAV